MQAAAVNLSCLYSAFAVLVAEVAGGEGRPAGEVEALTAELGESVSQGYVGAFHSRHDEKCVEIRFLVRRGHGSQEPQSRRCGGRDVCTRAFESDRRAVAA